MLTYSYSPLETNEAFQFCKVPRLHQSSSVNGRSNILLHLDYMNHTALEYLSAEVWRFSQAKKINRKVIGAY